MPARPFQLELPERMSGLSFDEACQALDGIIQDAIEAVGAPEEPVTMHLVRADGSTVGWLVVMPEL